MIVYHSSRQQIFWWGRKVKYDAAVHPQTIVPTKKSKSRKLRSYKLREDSAKGVFRYW